MSPAAYFEMAMIAVLQEIPKCTFAPREGGRSQGPRDFRKQVRDGTSNKCFLARLGGSKRCLPCAKVTGLLFGQSRFQTKRLQRGVERQRKRGEKGKLGLKGGLDLL
ncbi:hypothetical protein CEXT_115651 [Caerostris extrusa]|uniref:Uncharacterized protein n=1 Tax=Caerostris extrusa TaxID=172846 RepID=A0AAV4RYW7_CAEEX|nr:hypothetical protein CEXT_115651 [Caerostris extrusa]